MQGVEPRSGALHAPGDALAGAGEAFGERNPDDAGVEDNPVLGHPGERPRRPHAPALHGEPVCRLPRHTEGACSVLARVELGEPPLWPDRVEEVVAQDVALAGMVADRPHGVRARPGSTRWP